MRNWRKEAKGHDKTHCRKCREKIEANEERYVLKTSTITSDFYHLDCGEEIQTEIDKEVKEKLEKYINELGDINEKESNLLTANDYKNTKFLKKELEEFSKRNLEDVWNTIHIDLLKNSLQELEKYFPERVKLKANWKKNKRCPHKEVYLKLDEIAYCSDCGEDENSRFLHKLGQYHKQALDAWTSKHNLKTWSTLDLTNRLLETFTTQNQLKGVYRQVANELNQLAKSKGINDPIEIPNSPDPEREREREQIRRKIKRLERKTNRTPEEEQELADLRKKLRELEKNNQEQKPFNYLPWIIGGSVLVVGIIIIAWLFSKKKKRNYY